MDNIYRFLESKGLKWEVDSYEDIDLEEMVFQMRDSAWNKMVANEKEYVLEALFKRYGELHIIDKEKAFEHLKLNEIFKELPDWFFNLLGIRYSTGIEGFRLFIVKTRSEINEAILKAMKENEVFVSEFQEEYKLKALFDKDEAGKELFEKVIQKFRKCINEKHTESLQKTFEYELYALIRKYNR